MQQIKTNWISARAYALWEQNGKVHGKDAEHWQQASEEYEKMIETKASVDGAEIIAQHNVTELRARPPRVLRYSPLTGPDAAGNREVRSRRPR